MGLDVVGLGLAKADAARRYSSLAQWRTSVLDALHSRNPEPVMAAPPTVGAVTTTTSLTGSIRRWAAITTSSSVSTIGDDYWTTTGAAGPAKLGNPGPQDQYVRYTSLTNPTTGPGTGTFGAWNKDFWHDGTQFEIRMYQSGGLSVRVWVDGELVSAAPLTFSTSPGSDGYVLLTFTGRAVRRIRIESSGGAWGGLVTPAADNIWKADVRGPLVLIIADSYGEGANGPTFHSAFPRRFSRRMGWHRTIASAVGGTGYLNPGPDGWGRVKFRDRLANDVFPFNPDIVIWAGGHNDGTYSAAAVQAEAAACFAAVKTALPNARQFVTSPLMGPGPRSWGAPSTIVPLRDALKAAAVGAGLPFLDAMFFPMTTDVSTTVAQTVGAASTSMNLPTVIPLGSVVNINGGNEFNVITGVSGGGPYAHTLAFGMARQHNAGEPVVRVGNGLWTGTGTAAAPTGDGNSDFLVSNDAVHPTKEGQDVIGDWLAAEVARVLYPSA